MVTRGAWFVSSSEQPATASSASVTMSSIMVRVIAPVLAILDTSAWGSPNVGPFHATGKG